MNLLFWDVARDGLFLFGMVAAVFCMIMAVLMAVYLWHWRTKL
jgi:hypothetical protein